MKLSSSPRGVGTMAAILALIGAISLSSHAAPIGNNVISAIAQDIPLPGTLGTPLGEVFADSSENERRANHLVKRQQPKPVEPSPPPPKPPGQTTGGGGKPQPTDTAKEPNPKDPKPTNEPPKEPPKQKPPVDKPPATSSHAQTTSSSGRSGSTTSGPTGPTITASLPTGTGGTGTTPTGGPVAPGDETVPTGVSKNVLIGLGTVGGFFVFALGGVAFCRHRKKKNLASALLQQTAQFNNNNPYAKLPDPVTPKESLPMTPTKPMGTYAVVATYTPALADEIEIGLGDSVTILQEFDDGWCMGVNNTRGGAKGVFPRHCVEMGPYEGSQHGAPGGPHYPPSPSFKAAASKRMSSIPQSWGDNGGGYNPNANYPPQPSPQYNGGGY